MYARLISNRRHHYFSFTNSNFTSRFRYFTTNFIEERRFTRNKNANGAIWCAHRALKSPRKNYLDSLILDLNVLWTDGKTTASHKLLQFTPKNNWTCYLLKWVGTRRRSYFTKVYLKKENNINILVYLYYL